MLDTIVRDTPVILLNDGLSDHLEARAELKEALRASGLLGDAAVAGDEVTWIADSHGCKVANTFPRPGETITWSGKCKEGFADGDGVLQWFLDGKLKARNSAFNDFVDVTRGLIGEGYAKAGRVAAHGGSEKAG